MHSLEEIDAHNEMIEQYKEEWKKKVEKEIDNLAEYDEKIDDIVIDYHKLQLAILLL